MGSDKFSVEVQPIYSRILELDSYVSNKDDSARYIGKLIFTNSAHFNHGNSVEFKDNTLLIPRTTDKRRQNLIEITMLSLSLEKTIKDIKHDELYILENQLPTKEYLKNIDNIYSISFLFNDFKRILQNENVNDPTFFRDFGKKVSEAYKNEIPFTSEPFFVNIFDIGKMRNKRQRYFAGEIDVIKKVLQSYK